MTCRSVEKQNLAHAERCHLDMPTTIAVLHGCLENDLLYREKNHFLSSGSHKTNKYIVSKI